MMSKYLTAIIGVLVGVIGVLAGLFTSTNTKRKQAEKKVEESKKTLEISNEIANVINKPSETKQFNRKKSGTLGKLIILVSLSYIVSCSYYEPSCPNLYVIPKPEFKDIKYTYEDTIGYVFVDDDMEELYRQFNWAKETINKYEEEINIYNKYIKNLEE